jgi:CheY-like chemotaxis protein
MQPEKKLILVVDDSVEIREFFQLVLEGAGHAVALAADGREGFDQARARRPDLIITDIWMPRVNGFELLVKLRSDLPPPLPPVIVCSGFDVTADEALRLGAARFLAKPAEPATLLAAVAQALRGEAADESALARERQLLHATRARSAAAAARLLAGVDLRSPALARQLDRFAQRVSDYFGFAWAGLKFAEGDQILVAGTSHDSPVASGTLISGDTLYSTGVLGSGASLVLPDTTAFNPSLVKMGVRLLVAVPLLSDGVPIGALCLGDREPHPFDAEDLIILEHMGRNAALGLEHVARNGEPPTQHFGFAPPNLFDPMLAAELSILHREGGGADLLLVETDGAALQPDLGFEIVARGGARSEICRRGNGTVAVFKRDPDAQAATHVIAEALAVVSSVTGIQATGWVSVENRGLPLVPQQLLLQMASLALDESRANHTAEPERVVIAANHCRPACGAG